MRSKFTGIAKVLAVSLPFALAFSLSACGDDSSSGTNGDEISGGDSGNDDEDNDRTKAYCSFDGDEWVIDVIEGSDEYIQWREGKAIVVSKKKMGSASTCKSMLEQGGLSGTCDDEGYLTTTLNVEKYASYSRDELRKMIKEEWYNCVSASDGKSSSSGKGGSANSSSGKGDANSSSSGKTAADYDNPFDDMDDGCDFDIDDKVWTYYTTDDMLGVAFKGHFYEYKSGGSVDSSYTYTYGSEAKTLCKFMGGAYDTSYTNNYGEKVHSKYWCTDNGTEEFESRRGINDGDRETAYAQFKMMCEAVKDIPAGSSSSAKGGKSSSSESDDESSSSAKSSSSAVSSSSAKSSSSEVPKSSSSYEIVFPTKYGKSCEFSKTDDTWYVQNENSYIVYEWTNYVVKETKKLFENMGDNATCEAVKGLMPGCEEDGCVSMEYACEAGTLVGTGVYQFEKNRDNEYRMVMYDECGIEVVENRCDFDKNAMEWIIPDGEDYTLITWDESGKYTHAFVTVWTMESEEVCEAEVAALLEAEGEGSEDYSFEATCEGKVLRTKTTDLVEQEEYESRDDLYQAYCLY